jgi:hypothetical protein
MDFVVNALLEFDVDEDHGAFFYCSCVRTFELSPVSDPNFYNLLFALWMMQSVINVLAAIVIYVHC